ncbi:MAG TPA: OPT/YSL family transporter, partial [Polyangia bacterium]|nr:OPT/YSL family transporter [Polyangia bacterium]
MAAPPLPLPADAPPPSPADRAPAAAPEPTRTELVRVREATPRAILVGCGIGVVLAAGNVYTGLKTAFIDGGSITAALLGFTFFTTFRNLARKPYSALENNVTQTTAASAAIMAFVLGVYGPIPALGLMGHQYPGWAIGLWGIALGLIGILIGAVLRRKLVIAEELPFPTGAATAEVIETMYVGHETALRRARLLLLSALLAAGVTWFRDGRPSVIPGGTMLPGTIAGVSAATLTLGINWSPLMASTGMF